LKSLFLFLLSVIILVSCSGNKPEPNWTAKEYFQYAKVKYDEESYFDASNEFTVVLLRFPGSSVADSAQYYLAASHYQMDEFLIAAVEYEKLVNTMSQSSLVPDAQFQMAESYYRLSPRAALDQEYTQKAIRAYQGFIEDYPSNPLKEKAEKRILELRSKLALKEFKSAEIYRKMKEFRAALIYYDQVLDNYYDTEWADDAQYGKIRTYLELEDREMAQLEVSKFEQQFPQSELLENLNGLKSEILSLEQDSSEE